MPASDLPLLVEAARQASEIALHYWKSDQQVQQKDGGSPVSEGDFAVDQFLKTKLLEARADYGWLSEETPDNQARLEKRQVFIVDPIDGTRAYVDGKRTWAISIAVAQAGVPTAGVVFLPARDMLYAASLGHGAQLNGSNLQTGTRADPHGASVLAPRPSLDPKWWAKTPPDLERQWRSSLAYRFCMVAEGRMDAMLTIKDAWECDIAAGVLIAAEAGAAVTDRNGGAVTLNTPQAKAAGIFTAPPLLHQSLIEAYTGVVSR